MKRILIVIIIILVQVNAFAQMQKIFNIENVNNSHFGTFVSIWDNYSLIGNKYYDYSSSPSRDIANIFMKKNKKWIEVDNKLFSTSKRLNIGILNDKNIIAEDSFYYDENSLQIWSRKDDSKYYLSDSIIIDTSTNSHYYYKIHKTIYKDWLMFRIYYFDFPPNPFNSYYVDYFYHYENNKWIEKNAIKDNFGIGYGSIGSVRSVMKDNFVLFTSNLNIYFYKKINDNWELFQKEPISNEVLFSPAYSLFNVSISPNEKWSVCGGTYTLDGFERKNF